MQPGLFASGMPPRFSNDTCDLVKILGDKFTFLHLRLLTVFSIFSVSYFPPAFYSWSQTSCPSSQPCIFSELLTAQGPPEGPLGPSGGARHCLGPGIGLWPSGKCSSSFELVLQELGGWSWSRQLKSSGELSSITFVCGMKGDWILDVVLGKEESKSC